MTIVQYDSVDLSTIPADAQAVAGYVGGMWPNYGQVVRQWPHAHHLSIAINSAEQAECLDVEKGDATPEQAPAWFHEQIKRGVERPCLYASLSVCKESLVPIMEAAGIHRAAYRLWSAHYTMSPHICGPSEGLSEPADATQWTDRALGRNLDESLCSDGFYGVHTPVDEAALPEQPNDERNWIKEWDRLEGKRTLPAHLRRLFLKREMIQRRALIAHKASTEHDGWNVRNRVARWHALKERTG